MSRMAAPVPAITFSFQPVEEKRGKRWVYISMLQGHFLEVAFHWPGCSHMAIPGCKEGWEMSFPLSMAKNSGFFYWGRRGDRYWEISSCCSHSSTSVLMLGKMKGLVFPVFISPAFFLLFLLPDGRFVWPLTHTFQERQWLPKVCSLLPTCHLWGDCCYTYFTST